MHSAYRGRKVVELGVCLCNVIVVGGIKKMTYNGSKRESRLKLPTRFAI